MTIFAVMTAGLFPVIHLGRIWKSYCILSRTRTSARSGRTSRRRCSGTSSRSRPTRRLDHLPLRRPDSRPRDRARPRHGLAQGALRRARRSAGRARRASGRRTTAPCSTSRRPRDAAGALGAQRRVLGLRHVHRAGLARDDLRALLRRRRDLLGLRDGAHADDPGAPDLRARARTSPTTTSRTWPASCC